jgi:hypothetical protein
MELGHVGMVILSTWCLALVWYYLPAQIKRRALYFVHLRGANVLKPHASLSKTEIKSK